MMVDNRYNITLVNLYGPNRDDTQFYIDIGNTIEEWGSEFIIMCEDWNLVQDFHLDFHNYVKENNPRNRQEIQNLKNKFNLVDPWRVKNPTTKTFTWSRRNPIKQARLDFFLISEELLSILENVKIIPGYRTFISFHFISFYSGIKYHRMA
jgi:exonuclease III